MYRHVVIHTRTFSKCIIVTERRIQGGLLLMILLLMSELRDKMM